MSKKGFSVTISEEILNSFKKYTEKECINVSQLIEKMVKEYLKKKSTVGKKDSLKNELNEKEGGKNA